MLLDEPVLRAAILDHLTQLTGTDLSGIEWFVPESISPDLARPDLEGMQVIDGESVPKLVVEMKFGARLDTGQIVAYVQNQSGRLKGASGAFVLLVPGLRRGEAERVLSESLSAQSATELPVAIGHGVVTWEEWLDVWEGAVEGVSQGPDSIAADVAQLRAMCVTLCDTFIAPFPSIEPAAWRDREQDLRHLIKDVSQAVTLPGERRLPARQMGWWWGRWVYTRAPRTESYLGLGVVPRFADAGDTPLWVLFDKHVDGFHEIRARLMNSPVGRDARLEEGGVWLPLTVPPKLAGLELIEAVTAQVREIIAVATQPSRAVG